MAQEAAMQPTGDGREWEESADVRPWIRGLKESCRAQYRRFFPERQVFLRARGRVRFLRLKPGVQAAAAALGAGFLAWLIYASAVALVGDPRQRLEAQKARYLAQELDLLTQELARLQAQAIQRLDQLEASQKVLEAAVGPIPADSAAGPQTPPGTPGDGTDTGEGEDQGKAAEDLRRFAARTDALLERIASLKKRSERLATVLDRRERVRLAAAGKLFAELELAQPLAAVESEPSDERAVGGPFVPADTGGAGGVTGVRIAPVHLEGVIAGNPGPLLPQARELLERLQEAELTRRLLLSLPSAEPSDNYYISSYFGLRRDPFRRRPSMHYGLDMAGWRGEPVRAAAGGIVVHAGPAPAYGLMVEIDHGNGYHTRYGHMLRVLVRKGERVEPGERIGLIGNTGRSTGTHLHWEVWQNGKPVDPLPFLKAVKDVRRLQKLFAAPAGGSAQPTERS